MSQHKVETKKPFIFNVSKHNKEEDILSIIAAYKNKYEEESFYSEVTKVSTEDGEDCYKFSFNDEKKAIDFFTDMAKQGHQFILLDHATQKVIAYSDGNGLLTQIQGSNKTLSEFREELQEGFSSHHNP